MIRALARTDLRRDGSSSAASSSRERDRTISRLRLRARCALPPVGRVVRPTFFSLVDDAIVQLPLLHRHHDVVMVRQVSAQTDVLRVLVRAQVAGESSLAAALETHVPRQVVLQRVPLAAGGALQSPIFGVAGAPRARSDDLRGRGVRLPAVDRRGSLPRAEALVNA